MKDLFTLEKLEKNQEKIKEEVKNIKKFLDEVNFTLKKSIHINQIHQKEF